MGAALLFLEHYHRESDEFLDHIIIGDETWTSHYAPVSKQQSQEWLVPILNKNIQENSSRTVQLEKSWPAFFFFGEERHSFISLLAPWRDH
jgi:hypothetical protein